MGAPNIEYENKYFDIDSPSIDLAKNEIIDESCNLAYGFKQRGVVATSPEPSQNRLCHACTAGYSRVGLYRCNKCPEDEGVNHFLIVLGIVVTCIILVALVKMTIADLGKTKLSESIQKCVLNYFQVASLFSSIPLRWPGPMQTFFDFQGSVSTIGEHLVNPGM